MKAGLDPSWWIYKEAPSSEWRKKIPLAILIVAGVISIVRLANWWFREELIGSLPFYVVLSLILWWGVIRAMLMWVSYIRITKPDKISAEQNLRVAIFTTSSPGEPLSMFEKTLEACAQISYPHTTYLLDDTRDPRFRELAEKHGAMWLELVGIPGAKAGKINAALKQTTEDFILVMDPDHIPFPNFFDEVLGYFRDEKVGFVQVSQAYYNQYRSFTAQGAAEQTYGFYGPTQMGLYGYNCSVAIGANCTFRRKALESAGGHGIGLAEDLITSIRIHSEGWKSVYAPVLVSRGLVPEDFGSFCKQQLKWARGVFEVLFDEVPRLFSKLTVWQRLSYITIGTYYLAGTIQFIFLLIPFIFFWTGILPANMDFTGFLLQWLPYALISIGIYLYVQRWMVDQRTERGLHWRGMVLKFACWPVFLLGFLLSLVNAEIPYIPTAKQAAKGLSAFIRPHIFYISIFFLTICWIVIARIHFTPEAALELTSQKTWGMAAFAAIALIMTVSSVYAAWQSGRIEPEDPWASVDVSSVEENNRNRSENHHFKTSRNNTTFTEAKS